MVTEYEINGHHSYTTCPTNIRNEPALNRGQDRVLFGMLFLSKFHADLGFTQTTAKKRASRILRVASSCATNALDSRYQLSSRSSYIPYHLTSKIVRSYPRSTGILPFALKTNRINPMTANGLAGPRAKRLTSPLCDNVTAVYTSRGE